MSDLRAYVQGQDNTLAGSGVTLSATSATFESLTFPDGTLITMTDFGTVGYGTFEPETSKEENFSFTGLTQNASGTATLTGITRGLAFKAPYTADSALRQSHAGGTLMRFTNSAPFYSNFANKENDETITGIYTFTTATRPVLSSDEDAVDNAALVTHGELARTSFSGTVNASTTQKGISEEATDAELQAGTGTGGTGARLFASGASHTQTATANKVPVGKSNAKLDDGWIALTTAGDTVYSDGTDLQRLAIGASGLYMRSTGSAPSWGGANLDEANTFFGATAITGAQATTLSAGATSNADSLHTHNSLVVGQNLSFYISSASGSAVMGSSGFSDAAQDLLALGTYDATADVGYLVSIGLSPDIGNAPYIVSYSGNTSEDTTDTAAASHPLYIGTDYWIDGVTSANIYKNGSAVTISGTERHGPLGVDNTGSLLLILYSTTKIAKFSGIAGTTITNTVADVTLDTAVSQIGFAFDDANNQYVCVDTTANILRKFNSSGTTVGTAAYTITDTNVKGVCLIADRYYLVSALTNGGIAGGAATINPVTVSLIPTTMTRG